MALEYWASAKLCGVEHRAPPTFGRAVITLGMAHILVVNIIQLLPKLYYSMEMMIIHH